MYKVLRRLPYNDLEASRLGRQHLLLYAELGKEALEDRTHQTEGWIKWRWYPKHHLMSHCIEDQISVSGSAAESWCYADEGAIGEAVHVAESCHASVLNRTVIDKYRI